MEDVKISQLTERASLTDKDYVAGVLDNGDGTFSNFRYNQDALVQAGRKQIMAGGNLSTRGVDANDTLSDEFFLKPVLFVIMNRQVYMLGVDFEQSTDEGYITWLNGGVFEEGVALIAFR